MNLSLCRLSELCHRAQLGKSMLSVSHCVVLHLFQLSHVACLKSSVMLNIVIVHLTATALQLICCYCGGCAAIQPGALLAFNALSRVFKQLPKITEVLVRH